MLGKDRQQTSESSTKASIASCGDAEDLVVRAHLIELGQQALAEVTAMLREVNRLSAAGYWHRSFTKH
jgi:hypothetical protein